MNRSSVKRLCTLVAVIFLVLIVAGCGPKVSQASFDKIKTGMTEEEVKTLLGPPTETAGIGIGSFSGASSKWTGKEGTIAIQLLNGKVQAKEFFKSEK